jgi:CHAT domain-containing protein
LDSLSEATTFLEQQLSRASASFQSQISSQSITTKDIKDRLAADEAAVEFISFPLYNKKWTDSTMYAALILLPKDTVAHFIPLCEERQLRNIFKLSAAVASRSTRSSKGGHVNAPAAFSDSLYTLIWKPLEQYLTGVHTVFYAPAGLLNRIAFNALRPDAAHFLIDKYQLHQLLSTRSIAMNTPAITKHATASIWGNIKYDLTTAAPTNLLASRGAVSTDTSISAFNLYTEDTRASRGTGFGPLPYTKTEMDSIEKVFQEAHIPTIPISGNAATEEAFKAMDGKSPQVLHLATHGFFLPVKENKPKENEIGNNSNTFTVQQNPMFRSGLVLAGGNEAWKGAPVPAGKEDGILTAYEIAQLDLSNTDLVVLSACETALGDIQGNEGVIGLQRALKMAGVKQMMVSLWPVPDKQTVELMNLFYHNWLSGLTTREALRQAQLTMKQQYEPYFWAAFTLVE